MSPGPSWRVTRPLRSAARRVRPARVDPAPPPVRYDGWLTHYYDDVLAPIDAACAAGGPGCFALFADLDVDLWALLLTHEYDVYPNLRALLPAMPDPSLQALWSGTAGVALAQQGAAFYRKLRDRYAQEGARPLRESRVLDFGCGWGRLTRFLARDVPQERLYGCDPVESILEVCRESRVPARLARSEFVPDRLPFDEPFDLAFAFSVFTHLSEPAHERCLAALHAALRSGGVLVLTIRPPAYMHLRGLDGPAYRFEPHPVDVSHPQYEGGEMTYGETVVTLPYVRERWSRWFELLHTDLLIGDLHQVVLTLRRGD